MPRFCVEDLENYRKKIESEMIFADEGLRTKCPEEPEFSYRGEHGAESEGLSHDDKVVRARNNARHTNKLLSGEAALMRIEKGTFGVCVQCEEEISRGRLDSRPTDPFCIDCRKENDETRGALPRVSTRREANYIHDAA